MDHSLHATEGGLQDVVGGSCHKYLFFCRDKHLFVVTKKKRLLSRQKYVVTNKHVFVATKQAYFCRDKRRALSRQTRVCHDKTFVATEMILVAVPANDTKY